MIGYSRKGFPVLIASIAVSAAAFAGTGEMKTNGCKGPSMCHTRPDVDSNDFMIDVGFLLEQARVTGNMYAYTLDGGVAAGANTQATNGRRPQFNLDWGLTVAVGRHFEHDDWDLKIHFDWIQTTGKDSTSTEFSQILIPVNMRSVNALTTSTNFVSADVGSSKHRIDYYMFDVMLGRGNFMSGCFAITPHVGIKAAWINNTVTNKFTGGTVGTDAVYMKRGDDFWGVGPQVGVNGNWGMSEGIGLFCDNSMAILLGYAKINDHSWSSAAANTLTMTYNEGSIAVLSPALKTFLGLQYEKPVYYGCQHIRIRGGWDTSFYFNQFAHSMILNETPNALFHTDENNTFGLTGLRIDLCWDF